MNKSLYIFSIAAMAIFAILAAWQLMESQTPYLTSAERVKAMPNTNIQFIGKIEHSSVKYDAESKRLLFVIVDEHGEKLDIIYNGAKPSNFDSAPQALVRGKYEGGKFNAVAILLKCPSKYEGAKK